MARYNGARSRFSPIVNMFNVFMTAMLTKVRESIPLFQNSANIRAVFQTYVVQTNRKKKFVIHRDIEIRNHIHGYINGNILPLHIHIFKFIERVKVSIISL